MSEKKRQSTAVILPPDGRGRHGKISSESLNVIKNHIHILSVYKSHYTKGTSEQKYLNLDLTIAQMYRLHKEHCQENNIDPEKKHIYRKLFKEDFNLSFHYPLQGTCEKCNAFKASLVAAHRDDKIRIEEKRARHHELAELAYKQKKTD